MFNTIILLHGNASLTHGEYRKFQKGDTVFGENCKPSELKRFDINDEEKAREELSKYRCTYKCDNVCDIDEYALEYCECDEDGDFIQGSDFYLADEENKQKLLVKR